MKNKPHPSTSSTPKQSRKKHPRLIVAFSYLFTIAIATFLLSSCNDKINLSQLKFDKERDGCGNFRVYTIGENNTSLTIRGDRDLLGISTTKQEFALPHENLEISINEFDGPIGNFYCDDAIGDEGSVINQYFPASGIAEIQITRDSIQLDGSLVIYEITIKLKDIEFEIDKDLKFFEEIDFNNIRVGWLPG